MLAIIVLSALSPSSVAAQDATATPAATVTPAPNAPRLELEFEELNDSGVSGTAILSESGGQTIVELSLEETGENHPAHIHAGTCGDLQPEPEYPLQNVGSEGQSTSIVDASLTDLIAGDFAIDLHLSPNELGTLIVCADIEGEPQVPSSAGTPDPGPTATVSVATETPASEPTATTVATQPPTPTPTSAPTQAATEAPAATQPPAPTPTPAETQVPRTAAAATRAIEGALAAATRASTAVIAQATNGGETPEETEPAVTESRGDANPAATEDVTNAPDGTGGALNDSEGAASAPLPGSSDPDLDGTVVLTTLDADTTRISIVLGDDAVTGDAIVHLHDGTCDAPGDVTLDLDPFDADGISETDVDLSLDVLLADGYFINVHRSETAYDTLLVCGELSSATIGMVMPGDAPEPEASGSSTDQTPAAGVVTEPEDERSGTGTTPVTTPEPTAAPAAVQAPAPGDVTGDGTSGDVPEPGSDSGKGSPVQVTGDGTSGDVSESGSDSGKGSPVDATTGLPQTTGTGPLPLRDERAIDQLAWLSGAIAFLFLAAAIWVRHVDLQRSRSITTIPSRHPSRWTRPDF